MTDKTGIVDELYGSVKNTVHQGLYDAVREIPDETERYNFYTNYAIEYLRERVEHMVINAGDLEATRETVRLIEGALDRIEAAE